MSRSVRAASRAIRAAEWGAFASLLERRAENVRRNADASGNADLVAVAVALMGVSADATSLAIAIRSGEPPEPAPEQEGA